MNEYQRGHDDAGPEVVLVNATYPPEPVVSAQIGHDLAQYLALSEMKVTVLCPRPSRPLGVEYGNFPRSSEPLVNNEAGVKVVRLPSYTSPQSTLMGRMRESLSFGGHVFRYLNRQPGAVDVLYANTWPLFSQELIARHCARRGIPLVLHVQDIYPEALETKLPSWLGHLVIPVLRLWDHRIAARAAKVVLVAPRARRRYLRTRLLSEERVECVHNWQDERRFAVGQSRANAVLRFKLTEPALNFLYLGNIGPTTDMALVIHAFAKASIPNSQLLVVGDGSEKQPCVALAERLGLKSVHFRSCASESDVPVMQSLADVCLLPLKKGVSLIGVPSKVAAYLFSAKPILAILDPGSDTAQCIREAQCGWVGETGDLVWLARQMTEIANMSDEVLRVMGERGKAYGLKHFSRAEGVKKLAGIILRCRNTRGAE